MTPGPFFCSLFFEDRIGVVFPALPCPDPVPRVLSVCRAVQFEQARPFPPQFLLQDGPLIVGICSAPAIPCAEQSVVTTFNEQPNTKSLA